MCHEGWLRRRREEDEARRLWEVFDRETVGEPPHERPTEVRLETERSKGEHEPASADR